MTADLSATTAKRARLITQSGDKDPEGWRLPAKALEDAVVNMIRTNLNRAAFAADLIRNASAPEIASLRTRLDALTKQIAEDQTSALLAAIT